MGGVYLNKKGPKLNVYDVSNMTYQISVKLLHECSCQKLDKCKIKILVES